MFHSDVSTQLAPKAKFLVIGLVEEEWIDSEDNSFKPQTFYNVGGNTKVYGAALQRMRAEDFGEVKHFAKFDGTDANIRIRGQRVRVIGQ